MYITILFLILLVAIVLAYLGQRDRAILIFGISFIFAIFLFFHHMTDSIGLSL